MCCTLMRMLFIFHLYAIVVCVATDAIRYRFDEETINKLLEKEWWNGGEEELKKVGEMEFRVGEYVGMD